MSMLTKANSAPADAPIKRASHYISAALHIVAPAIARKLDVVVRIGGASACTDAKTIWLPALPPEDDKATTLGFAHLFHEGNHVRETDVSARPKEPFAGSLWNALEDNRSDGLGYALYPGARRDREALINVLDADGKLNRPSESDAPSVILQQYCFWRLQAEYLGLESAKSFAEQAEALALKAFPRGAITKLDALMWRTPECKDSHQVAALANRICTMLEEESKDPPPDGDASQAQQPAGAPADGSTQPGSGTAQAPAADGAPAQPESTAEQRAALREALSESAQQMQDLGEVVKAALDEHAAQHSAEALEASYADSGSMHFSPAASAPMANESFDLDVRATSNALLYRIAGLLQAVTRKRRVYQASGRRIDSRRLAGIAVGQLNVFVQEFRGLSTNTAAMILVDRSGSTGGRPIVLAREACYALSLALERVNGVSVAAAAFPGTTEANVFPLLRFGERCARAADRFARLSAGGGTPLAEAMLWAGAELAAIDKPRRLLLVLTDGEYPSDLGRRVVGTLARSGIETGGIGIGAVSVEDIFPSSRVIALVDELPQAMFSLLLEMIKRKAHH